MKGETNTAISGKEFIYNTYTSYMHTLDIQYDYNQVMNLDDFNSNSFIDTNKNMLQKQFPEDSYINTYNFTIGGFYSE